GGRRHGGTIPLNDPEGVWWVRSGYVDVFSTVEHGGGSDRPLHHARIAAGGVLFGMPSSTEGGRVLVFVARPGPDAVVSPGPGRRQFLAEAAQGEQARLPIEGWAAAIGAGHAPDDA